ncbi:flagellar hook-associated protein FlgK [Alkalihalobacillus oceani]|uniref:flagellar hook-associated protein FlgK n=1 Tax=Halalkalibacter oceani TaxID=1653776 RepID=UPI00203ABF2F|nr:flagellar hook-associated protein FlgK [Halalkalibacter oceani]MCM3760914.1 flagellar hook-associated protein FlgK [Halalkalibacter oceani]
MQSTFHGLETARRAMMTQQYALHTVGHNIANANTPGYTRQRVNFSQTEPYPASGMNSPRIPGHLGTGVKAGSIQRVREAFLDVQYRNESNKVGYWDARYSSLMKMEDILNEPSENGLNHQIDLFWRSFQDLAGTSDDSGARSVVRERGRFIAESFNYMHDSLSEIRNDYKNEIEVTEKEVNALLRQLDNVNEQIRKVEPHGYVTNDLYDEQDRLIDQLSRIVNIKVEREQSGGKPSEVAEGAVTVYLVNENGQAYTKEVLNDEGLPVTGEDGERLLEPIKLVDGTGQERHLEMSIGFENGAVTSYAFMKEGEDGEPIEAYAIDDLHTDMPRGEMKALIEAYGYETTVDGETQIVGTYPDMLAEIDLMAYKFATEINNIHKLGFTLGTDSEPATNGGDFFDLGGLTDPAGAAKAIKIHANIEASRNNIAAAGVNVDALNDTVPFTLNEVDYDSPKDAYEKLMAKSPKSEEDYASLHALLSADDENPFYDDAGNEVNVFNDLPKAYAGSGTNALELANMKDIIMEFSSGNSGTIGSYYQSVIGDMAVNAQEAARMADSSLSLRDSVEFRRQSVSNVSADEEFTLMIQFQHAYNAAARNITMVDEMLDRIINNMGIVGR